MGQDNAKAVSKNEKSSNGNWSSYNNSVFGLLSNRNDSDIITLLEKSNKEDLIKYLVRDEDFTVIDVVHEKDNKLKICRVKKNEEMFLKVERIYEQL